MLYYPWPCYIITWPCYIIPGLAILSLAVLYYPWPCYYYPWPCYIIPGRTIIIPGRTILSLALLYYTWPCYIIPGLAILSLAVLYYPWPYYIIPGRAILSLASSPGHTPLITSNQGLMAWLHSRQKLCPIKFFVSMVTWRPAHTQYRRSNVSLVCSFSPVCWRARSILVLLRQATMEWNNNYMQQQNLSRLGELTYKNGYVVRQAIVARWIRAL